MAITRAQQAKQMLQDGGMLVKPGFGGTRQGYRGDAAAASGAPGYADTGPAGDARDGPETGAPSQDRIEEIKQANKTLEILEQDKLEEKLEKFRDLGSKQRQFQNYFSKISPFAAFSKQFGPLNTRDFFVDKVLGSRNFANMTKEQFANLTNKQQENIFDSYMEGRMSGQIDAYGNEINQGGGGGINQIIPIDTTFAQAPSDMEQEPEETKGLFRRFRADGGIMNSNVVGGEFDFESARQMYGLGKLVKKVTRTVKKIAKSPIGKAAIIGGLGYLGATKTAFGSGLLESFSALDPMKKAALIGGGLLTAAPFFMKPEEEDEEEEDRGEGLDIARIRANPNQFLARRFVAEGGSMKEPVAKKTMPLLDLDGKEMDLRADVPARLSKNEFVFTADAVRNAGDGDVDKGAEVMYNMMKNLESGGDVSKESQGLEGARRMFQTSQRLEEVL
jgi:hypothetical protein